MSRSLTIGSFAIAAFFAISVQSAHAGCADDIKQLRKQVENSAGININKQQALDKYINRAEEIMKKGKKKGCAKMVKKAREKLG